MNPIVICGRCEREWPATNFGAGEQCQFCVDADDLTEHREAFTSHDHMAVGPISENGEGPCVKSECSICRRVHGKEIRHVCE